MAKIIVSSSFTRAKFTSATRFLYSSYEANVRTCTYRGGGGPLLKEQMEHVHVR